MIKLLALNLVDGINVWEDIPKRYRDRVYAQLVLLEATELAKGYVPKTK